MRQRYSTEAVLLGFLDRLNQVTPEETAETFGLRVKEAEAIFATLVADGYARLSSDDSYRITVAGRQRLRFDDSGRLE